MGRPAAGVVRLLEMWMRGSSLLLTWDDGIIAKRPAPLMGFRTHGLD